MAKSIDKATILSAGVVQSRVLGQIPPTQLSGGLKTLILMYKRPDLILNATPCGNNCAFWILKIAKQTPQDITINLHHMMDFGRRPFTIKVLNTGVVVHNMLDLIAQAMPALTPQLSQDTMLEIPNVSLAPATQPQDATSAQVTPSPTRAQTPASTQETPGQTC
jgi:hypothetical protein